MENILLIHCCLGDSVLPVYYHVSPKIMNVSLSGISLRILSLYV
jgi:hypothetical protein